VLEKPFPAYKDDEPYIFVSYPHADDEIVYPEIQWLHDQGFNIWYDDGIDPGSTCCRVAYFAHIVAMKSNLEGKIPATSTKQVPA